MSAPEFVTIGHVTLDRFEDGSVRPGGAALYAAITAHRLGRTVGLLTSHADEFPLDLLPPRIEVVTVPAAATTVFEHARVDGVRCLRAPSGARPLAAADVPPDWRDAETVLLAPVLEEVDLHLVTSFGEAAIGAAAQGWLRSRGPDGVVAARPWAPAPGLLARVQVLVLSAEDVQGQEDAFLRWRDHVPLVILTAGAAGALLYVSGERYAVPARAARVVDPTGAGDVFAATFLIRYQEEGDPWRAAEAAACAAALAVEGDGWSTVPDRAGLEAALARDARA
jgi:1D-myo-inositol 3-kinase